MDREDIEHYLEVEKFLREMRWSEKKSNTIGLSRSWKLTSDLFIVDPNDSSKILEKLELKAHYSKYKDGYNMGLTLLHKEGMIERWDNGTKHLGADGQALNSPHKHYTEDGFNDNVAWIPDDVDLTKEPKGIIMDVFNEWKIIIDPEIDILPGEYDKEPPLQTTLEIFEIGDEEYDKL